MDQAHGYASEPNRQGPCPRGITMSTLFSKSYQLHYNDQCYGNEKGLDQAVGVKSRSGEGKT
jgi:hypothetical protein